MSHRGTLFFKNCDAYIKSLLISMMKVILQRQVSLNGPNDQNVINSDQYGLLLTI